MKTLVQRLAALSLLSLPLVGCSNDFERPSEIITLRVLAVRADQPFTPPGSQPQLTMLLKDGSPRAVRPDGTRRRVRVVWLGGCVNPPGDMYYNCYPSLHDTAGALSDTELLAESVPSSVAPGQIGYGESFAPTVAADIISQRPQPPGTAYPYGMQYAFFIACGGEVRRNPQAGRSADFPLACYAPGTGERLGDEDMVVGYFPIYAYDTLRNANPVVDGGTFWGRSPGAACAAPGDCPEGATCGTGGTCIPVVTGCTASSPDDCPEYVLRPAIDPSSSEPALTAQVPPEFAKGENLWVSYYSSAGRFTADTRLVFDPMAGWNNAWESGWRAWNVKGEVRLWAVVHDSRNGVTWWSQDVVAQ